MKYSVTFQELPNGALRPIDHPTASDFETDENGFGMIPNVGDFVHLIAMGEEGATYEGRVRTRLFRYFGSDTCGINIVVETGVPASDDVEWGKHIKE
jgi:hypothetical protein